MEKNVESVQREMEEKVGAGAGRQETNFFRVRAGHVVEIFRGKQREAVSCDPWEIGSGERGSQTPGQRPSAAIT